jgi:hypothetical protein
MGPGIFLIAIMGCGEGDAPCQQVRLLQTQYQSRAECLAASETALMANSNVDYPSVVAQCVSSRQAAALRMSPADVRLPEAPQHAVASRIASRR